MLFENRMRRVPLCVGLRKISPREFSCTQRLLLGALFDGRKRRPTCSLGSYLGFGSVFLLGLRLGLFGRREGPESGCVWGYVKAPPGS